MFFRLLLEIAVFVGVFYFCFTQLLYPAWKNQPLFPFWHNRKRAKLEKALKDANEALEMRNLKEELSEKKDTLKSW